MRRNNDILWKGITEEVFDDLLRFFFPKADAIIDFSRGFDFLDKELAEMYPEPDKASDTRFVDKLVKVYRRDGGEEWMLVYVEIQGETKSKDRPLFEDPEISRKFDEDIDQLTGKQNTMGIIEQLAEQRVEEKSRLVVENLLKQTDFSVEKIASLTATSVDFVLKLKKMGSA